MKEPLKNGTTDFISRTSTDSTFAYTLKKNTSTSKKVTYTTENDEQIQLAIMYFPGWELRLDGSDFPISYNSNGFINATIPAGSHTLDIIFTDTPLRIAGNTLTVITLLFVLITFSVQYIRGKRFVI